MEISTKIAKNIFGLLAKSTYKTDQYNSIHIANEWMIASNGVIQIEYKLPFDSGIDLCIDPEIMKKTLASIKDEKLSMSDDGDTLKIKTRNSSFTLNRLDANLPLIFGEEKLDFKKFDFFNDPMPLYFCSKVCSKFPADGNMNGVVLVENSMFATNGVSAIMVDFPDVDVVFDDIYIIPFESIVLLNQLNGPSSIVIDQTTAIFKKKDLFFDGDTVILSTSLLEKDAYPLGGGMLNSIIKIINDVKYIKTKSTTKLSNELLDAIKQSYIFADPDQNRPVACVSRNGKLYISTENQNGKFEKIIEQGGLEENKEAYFKAGVIETAFEISGDLFVDFDKHNVGYVTVEEENFTITYIISTKNME